MEYLGSSPEEIEKEVKALEAIKKGEIDEEIHYTKKFMANLGASPEEIEKEVKALEAIKKGEIDEEIYYTKKFMANLGASQVEINDEIKALEAIKKGTLNEQEYFTKKFMNNMGFTSSEIKQEIDAQRAIEKGIIKEVDYYHAYYTKRSNSWLIAGGDESVIANYNSIVDKLEKQASDYAKKHGIDEIKIAGLGKIKKEAAQEISNEITQDVISVVKLESRDFAYNVTKIENEIKEIQELASQGVVVDLESKALELGFTSFAESVEAYNKQNGTNYTPDEAKKELGY
jgi:hypothetical protein